MSSPLTSLASKEQEFINTSISSTEDNEIDTTTNVELMNIFNRESQFSTKTFQIYKLNVPKFKLVQDHVKFLPILLYICHLFQDVIPISDDRFLHYLRHNKYFRSTYKEIGLIRFEGLLKQVWHLCDKYLII